MKIAYFDCFAGAAGDMIVASMLDAGLDVEFLKAQLATLGVENLDIKITQTIRAGLRALKFEPVIPKKQHPRNLKQITGIINESKISKQAKKTAITIFNKLAQAEATVHNKDIQEIHFHEIGALDSIVDIISASIGLEALGIDKVFCSRLSVGGGTIKSAHGVMPVPAPATAELLKGIPITTGPTQAELLTPTAAAILTTVAEEFGELPAMKIESVGYGAGSLRFPKRKKTRLVAQLESEEFPNVLRLILGQKVGLEAENADSVCLLETNIDDVSGEVIGSITEKLLKQGAADVFTTPIYMKQNRPGMKISVICKIGDAEQLEQVLFEQGVTFGIRRQILQRSKLASEIVTVETEIGQIRIKLGKLGDKIVNAKPEFSDCVSAAKTHNVAVKAVLETAMAEYKRQQSADKTQ